MPELVEQINELSKKMDDIGTAAAAAQEAATRAENKKGELDPVMLESIKKASEDSAKAVEELNEIKNSMTAHDKTVKYVEKAINRMAASNDPRNETSEMELKAREATNRYLRSGQAFPEDVVESITKALIGNSFFGISDSMRDVHEKTMIAGVNPAGGYFIRPERSATMIKRIFETSPMRNIANIETTSSDVLEFIIDDDEAASGGWVGETSSRGNTDNPEIGLMTIPVHEQFAQPRITQKMLDDAGFDVESWLSGKVTRKMTRVENTAFVIGDGDQKPRGILNYPAWSGTTYERGKVQQINSGANGTFTGDGVKRLKNSVIEEYQPGAVFTIKRESFEDIITLKDGQGRYLLDTRSFKDGDTMVLLGKPVMFMTDMPQTGTTGALAMAYGDFGVGYTIVDRIGFRVIRDDVTDKPRIKFYTTKRVGGAVTSYESFKIQKLSA